MGLIDRSSVARTYPSRTEPCLEARVRIMLHLTRRGPVFIAGKLDMQASTVGRELRRQHTPLLRETAFYARLGVTVERVISDNAFAYRNSAAFRAVEGVIIGREIECAVLEGRELQPPRTSVLSEPVIDVEHDFYEFDAKYIDVDHIALRIPADLPALVVAEIHRQSALVFEELNCEGLARIDFL